jgi:hypothetical protein
MANWAKYIEDSTGLPVHKRARHGIHFKRPDGQIQAEFSGKPCHYLDGGLWKPIDTKLLLGGDGYYGCPHSPVRIKTDGNVKVDGSTYAQRIELPSAQTGLVDNDCIVRTFSFGEQRLWVTETGFKSEIVLNRVPTLAEAKLLIATESGTLPVTYLKSLTRAVDANGNSHTFTTLTKFRTWLASAAFPVTIDPDFSDSSPSDNSLHAGASYKNYGTSTVTISYWGTYIGKFDCSSVSSGSVISSGDFKFTKANASGASRATTHNIYSIALANSGWVAGTQNGEDEIGSSCQAYKALNTVAWAGSAGLGTAGTDYETDLLATFDSNQSDAQYTQYTATLTTAGKTRLAGWFGSTNTNYGIRMNLNEWTILYTEDVATESYRPVLSVTYTAAGNPHFMSLLGVGS